MKWTPFLTAAGVLLSTAVIAAPDSTTPIDDALEAPTKLTADGKPIDTAIGHAAPYVYDWNKDGKPDLLVGQFGGGKLKIYLNTGTAKAPKYGKPIWFDGTIPSG